MTVARTARGSRIRLRIIGIALAAITIGGGVLVGLTTVSHTYTAVVVTVDIAAGTPITDANVRVMTFNGQTPSSDIITQTTLKDVLNKVATSPIYTGAVLQGSMLFRPVDANLPPAERKFATRLSELLVGDQRAVVVLGDPTSTYVAVGDKVDLFWIGTPTGVATPIVQRLMTKTVLYNVPVPAAADDTQPAGTAYILDLTAQESQDLVFAQASGDLRIAIASPTSTSDVPTCTSTEQWFAKTYGVTLPAGALAPTTPTDPGASPAASGAPSPTPFASAAPSPATGNLFPGSSAAPTTGCN